MDMFDGGSNPPSYDSSAYHNAPVPPPQYFAMQYYPMESPPKYEDILKEAATSSNTEQGVQTSEQDNAVSADMIFRML